MKKVTPHLRTLLTGLILLVFSPTINAFEPPPVLTLEERVKYSSHIFIGKVGHQYFVDGLGRRLSPIQAARLAEKMRNNPVIQVEVHVSEVLFPRSTKIPKLAKFRYQLFGTVYQGPKDTAKRLANILNDSRTEAGKRVIFLTDYVELPKQGSFYASRYDTFYYEPIAQRSSILKMIAKRNLPVSKR